MVQKERMMSLAASDIGGSWGNKTGFSTILRMALAREGSYHSGLGFNVLLVDLNRVLMPEGRIPGKELVDEDAERPPIHGCRMTLVMDHLGREILGRAA
jgi:hypothetical protein